MKKKLYGFCYIKRYSEWFNFVFNCNGNKLDLIYKISSDWFC